MTEVKLSMIRLNIQYSNTKLAVLELYYIHENVNIVLEVSLCVCVCVCVCVCMYVCVCLLTLCF